MPLSAYRVIDFSYEDVDTLSPDAPLRAVLEGIGATKYDCYVVIDGDEHPVGIVTTTDIIHRLLAEEPLGGGYLKAILQSSEAAIEFVREAQRTHGHTAADVMTTPVITLEADETLRRAAEILEEHHFKRIPVVRDGKLVGIFRAVDLIGPALDELDSAGG
jgi:CBS domain-containing protein